MLKRLWPAIVLTTLLVAGISAFALESKIWAAVAIGLAAIFLNGLVATLEDELPGGFNNPDGLVTPKYAKVVSWIIRGVGVFAFAVTACVLWLVYAEG